MNNPVEMKQGPLQRVLPLALLVVAGAAAVGFGLRAVAQQPVTPAAPTATAAPAAAPPAAAAAASDDPPAEDESLRQSADNNISFPVDI